MSNPVNDAKDMAQLLRELGFEVIYKQKASQAEMKSAIWEFGNNIVRGDAGTAGPRLLRASRRQSRQRIFPWLTVVNLSSIFR